MGLEKKIVVVVDQHTKKTTERFYANYPNIRTLQGFLKGEWDLSLFDSCFKGRNRLGDVDASIELNGHTLLIEFKGHKGGMNKGQVLKAIRQAKYSNITTMFIFGTRNSPEAYLTIAPDSESEKGFSNSGYIEAELDEVRDEIKDWTRHTEANQLVKSKTEEWEEVNKIMGDMYNG